MLIDGFDLESRVMVIAEIGNNHEGDASLARDMIRLAAEAGADIVKFQTIVPDELVPPEQVERLAQLRRFRLSDETFAGLAETAREAGIMFVSSPFSQSAVRMLDPLVPAYKVASSDNNHLPLLQEIARTGKPVLISAGMADIETMETAVRTLRSGWQSCGIKAPGVAVLHCVSAYPTPRDEANLLAIRALEGIGDAVGYSDHTLGIHTAVAAVAIGARVIEKHFTIDNDYSEFRDHKLSADPKAFAEMVLRIREVEEMRGDGRKRVMPSEEATTAAARRSICAARDLPTGTTIAEADIHWLRQPGGLAPGKEHDVIGAVTTRAIANGEILTMNNLRPANG